MKTSVLRRVGLALSLGVPLALVLAALLALQSAPSVPPAPVLTPDQVARAKHFLRSNDPRRTPPGSERRLVVPEAELELLLLQLGRHALAERAPALQLRLEAGAARLQLSQALRPALWLNLDLQLGSTDGRLHVDALRLGRLPLPAWLGQALARAGLERLSRRDEVALARALLKQVHLQRGQLELVYDWQADSYRRLMAGLFSPAEQARLQAHADALQRWAAGAARQGVLPLVEALSQAFALARERSLHGGDAAAENRAALLSLALYATGRSPASLLGAAAPWPPAQWLPMRLQGRPDFPMHFIVSAALAATGGGPLSDALGVYKEQFDSRYGSGFSFNDMAADRAGTRFGLAVMRAPAQLQQRIAAGLGEQDLLPDLSDLPEYLTEAEFRQRYGGVDAPAYRQMMAAIEARLDLLPLLR